VIRVNARTVGEWVRFLLQGDDSPRRDAIRGLAAQYWPLLVLEADDPCHEFDWVAFMALTIWQADAREAEAKAYAVRDEGYSAYVPDQEWAA